MTKPTAELFRAARAADLRQLLPRLGYAVRGDGKVDPNPIRAGDGTPSLSINSRVPSRWRDFGVPEGQPGAGGDLIDFLQQARGPRGGAPLSRDEAIREAAHILGVNLDPPRSTSHKPSAATTSSPCVRPEVPPMPPKSFDDLVDNAHDALLNADSPLAKKAIKYLGRRGFATTTLDGEFSIIKHARLGVIDNTVKDHAGVPDATGRIVLPYLDAVGRPEFLNARHPSDDHDRRYRYPSGAQRTVPFGWHGISSEAGFAVLVEGELDALSVLEATRGRVPTIATGGGAGTESMHRVIAKGIKRVLLMFDADEQGSLHAQAAQVALEALGVTTLTLPLPAGVKDPNEALVRRGALAFAVHVDTEIVRALADIATATAAKLSDISFIGTTYLAELKHRHERPFSAYPTGVDRFDKLIGGGYSEGVHVLVGGTGLGKTAFALNVAQRSALRGRHVLILTYEMSAFELWSRLIAYALGVPATDLKRGIYRDPEHGTRLAAHEYLPASPAWATVQKIAQRLRIIEAGDALSQTISDFTLDTARDLAHEVKAHTGAPPLVIVDYIQRAPAPPSASKEPRERVDHVVASLQVGLARGVGCPVLALSSISRAFYDQNRRSVRVEDLLRSAKESGGVEYTAATVTVLHGYARDPETNGYIDVPAGFDPRSSKKWVPLALTLAKNREGPIMDENAGSAAIPLRWFPSSGEWDDKPDRSTVNFS